MVVFFFCVVEFCRLLDRMEYQKMQDAKNLAIFQVMVRTQVNAANAYLVTKWRLFALVSLVAFSKLRIFLKNHSLQNLSGRYFKKQVSRLLSAKCLKFNRGNFK